MRSPSEIWNKKRLTWKSWNYLSIEKKIVENMQIELNKCENQINFSQKLAQKRINTFLR